jgi:hypothetical protein
MLFRDTMAAVMLRHIMITSHAGADSPAVLFILLQPMCDRVQLTIAQELAHTQELAQLPPSALPPLRHTLQLRPLPPPHRLKNLVFCGVSEESGL